MAKAVQEGAQEVSGAEVILRRVREFAKYVQHVEQEKGYSYQVYQYQAGVPECTVDDLRAADGVIFGIPTRYGNLTAQMMEGELNEFDIPKDFRRRASTYGRRTCVRRSRARQSAGEY